MSATRRDCPDALEEGSDAALASALKVVERIFATKSPAECARSLLQATPTNDESLANDEQKTSSSTTSTANPVPAANVTSNFVETLLAVTEATPEAPGTAAATCLWWVSGARDDVTGVALGALLARAANDESAAVGEAEVGGREASDAEDVASSFSSDDDWAWFPVGQAEEQAERDTTTPPRRGQGQGQRPGALAAARFLAALCLCKPGAHALESGVRAESPGAVEALVHLCGAEEPILAGACFRIVERLAARGLGPLVFVDAGVLDRAAKAGARFFEIAEDKEEGEVGDAEAYAIAAALGAVAALAEVGGKNAHPTIDSAFRLSVRCLAGVGEFSGRPAAGEKILFCRWNMKGAHTFCAHAYVVRIFGVDTPNGKVWC